jgi:seryl-tRNA(Sec) selenium transferase
VLREKSRLEAELDRLDTLKNCHASMLDWQEMAQELSGWAVALEPGELSVDELEEKLRLRAKPIVARIHRRQYLLCVRTIREEDFAEIAAAAMEAIR